MREGRVPPSLDAAPSLPPMQTDTASGNIREWHFLFQGWVSLSWVTSGRLWFPVITGLSSLPREWFLDLELPAPDLSSYFRLVTCIFL